MGIGAAPRLSSRLNLGWMWKPALRYDWARGNLRGTVWFWTPTCRLTVRSDEHGRGSAAEDPGAGPPALGARRPARGTGRRALGAGAGRVSRRRARGLGAVARRDHPGGRARRRGREPDPQAHPQGGEALVSASRRPTPSRGRLG